MGSTVSASSQKPGPAPDLSNIPPSPPSSTQNVAPISKTTELENPGLMEELHKKCRDLFPVNFEGGKIMVQKCLSNHFQVSHCLNLSSMAPSGYRFGATYVGTQQFGPAECYPVLVGEIDPAGNLNANVYHKFNDNIVGKFQAQVQGNKFTASQLVSDYKGSNFSASVTIANPDIINDQGIFIGHYLQSVTKRLALGGELVYQRSPQIPGGQIAMVSLAGRYSADDYCFSATLGVGNFHVCYYQKASEQLQIGVEMETNLRMQESTASVGYQIDLPKADLVFKGMLDTNWNVGATLEKKLSPMPFTLTLSGLLNHQKNAFRMGLGFLIG